MRLLLNVVWVVFGGFWLWLLYLLAGVVACVTIIGIPLGLAAFRIGWFALWPFGRTVVDHPAAGAASTLGNVLWVIFFGWWLALGHVTTAIAQAVTIVGIPLALGNLKLIPVSLLPSTIDPQHLGFNAFVYDSDTQDKTGQTRIGWSTFGGVQGDPYRWGVATTPGWTPPAVPTKARAPAGAQVV